MRISSPIKSPIKRLTSKGQLTLPMSVRQAWGIKPGDKLELTIGKGNVLLIRPLRQSIVESTSESLRQCVPKDKERI